ncbi:MAG TPA: FAD-dependent oxidoreductase, partial [Abditibacterium sp.]
QEATQHLEGARQLSLSFVHWMQTEAPRHDGGNGYPEVRLRGDVTGTLDGLAKYPYIRESRRILAEFTVCEQHVASDLRPDGAEKFADSVGIGCYRIDLHPSTGGRNYIDVGSQPFQIPLGALIPRRLENLLPACKNLGVTHITNGCYRLHPVEWNIGEGAGALAAWCLDKRESPRGVRNSPAKLQEFQKHLESAGIELDWPQLHAV